MMTLPINAVATVLILLTNMAWLKDTHAAPIITQAAIGAKHPVLTLNLSNIKENARNYALYIAIYSAAAKWTDEPLLKMHVTNATFLPLQISDLAAGHYAIRLFIDTNGNGQLDLNTKNLPVEPFGFSGNIKLRRMPTVSEAVFELANDMQQTIKIYQPRLKTAPSP